MSFKDLIDFCHVDAIANKLQPTEDSVWRSICRRYSEKFHTPLDSVLTLDPEFVIKHHFESQYEDVEVDENLENLLDIIYRIEDPEYAVEQNKELEEFIQKAELEEENRLSSGKSIMQSVKDKLVPEKPKQEKPLPTQGFIDLSYLEKLDSEK